MRVLRDPEASRHLAEAAGEGYLGIAEQLREARPELSDAQVEAVAKLDFALVQSLGILWLLAPDSIAERRRTRPSGGRHRGRRSRDPVGRVAPPRRPWATIDPVTPAG